VNITNAWRVRELPGAQLFVLETPALVLTATEHIPRPDVKAPPPRYPQQVEGYRWDWVTVAIGSEENLDAICEMLVKADARMF
jgi:hypothetical protein